MPDGLIPAQTDAAEMPLLPPIANATAMFERLKELKKEMLSEDDYQTYSQKDPKTKKWVDKKFVKRSGCEKYSIGFGLSTMIVSTQVVPSNDGITQVICTARVYRGTRAVESNGACSSLEKRKKVYKDDVWTGDYEKKDAAQMLHNVTAHAQTRAIDRAILQFIGSGEISMAEISGTNMANNAQSNNTAAPPANTTAAPNNTAPANKDPNAPSDKQLSYIQNLGYTGAPPNTKQEASDIISRLKGGSS